VQNASICHVGDLEHDFHVVLDQMLAEMQEKNRKAKHPKVAKDFGAWHTNKKPSPNPTGKPANGYPSAPSFERLMPRWVART
jgi:hypothetical protein